MVCTRAASVDDCPENQYYREPWGCTPCAVCQDYNMEVLQPCLPQSNAVCGDCFPGHYLDQRYCHSCVYAPADHRYCQLWLASQTTARPAASTTMSTSTHTIIQTTPPSSTEQASRQPTNDINTVSMSTSSNPSKLKEGPTLGPGPVAAIVIFTSVAVLTLIGTLVWRIKQSSKCNKEEATPVQATDEDQQGHSYP
ncbi:uncharacterized protein LOC144871138 isoform X2 [Branchiostoma floridae x Branchiostoma japonicum]